MGEQCSSEVFSLVYILVLAGTTGAGGMTPPTSTALSAMMGFVHGQVGAVVHEQH